MKTAFITEMGFRGKVPSTHPNMRVEFAWMHAMDADHIPIHEMAAVKGYDKVFIIFPKGKTFLSAEGSKLIDGQNPVSGLLQSNIVTILKESNTKVYYVQEGPTWWFNDYEILDQLNFYNLLSQVDGIYAHNDYDCKFYKGLFPSKPVKSIPTLLIEDLIKDITPQPEEKVIIGGNFARWYGGFQSYVVADELGAEKWGQSSHAKRNYEDQIEDLNHLPRLTWVDWMKQLSTFKYAIHLMPTVAAGTFSLNCAYFGIPCIGNEKVDTQRICHPLLSVDVENIEAARQLAIKLKNPSFYKECSEIAKRNYREFYDIEQWKKSV